MRPSSVLMLIGAVLFSWHVARADDSVVFGKSVDQERVPGPDNGCESPDALVSESLDDSTSNEGERLETLCLAHPWYRWTIAVDYGLSGPPTASRIMAVRRQHTEVRRSYVRSFKLFVLSPIVEPAERRRLGADYYLVEMSEPHYCISTDPEELGLDVYAFTDDRGSDPAYCFSLPKDDE